VLDSTGWVGSFANYSDPHAGDVPPGNEEPGQIPGASCQKNHSGEDRRSSSALRWAHGRRRDLESSVRGKPVVSGEATLQRGERGEVRTCQPVRPTDVGAEGDDGA
jgi:hypothetical protein